MSMASQASGRGGAGSAALWFGVLGGPAAWSLQVILGYGAEEIACSPGSRSQELAGIRIESFIFLVGVVLTLVTLAALLVSIRCFSVHRAGDPTTGDRAKWMGIAGIMVSVLFLIAIANGFAPLLFLEECVFTP
jgi:hypothetical protein